MTIFYLIAVLCASITQHNAALIHYEHTEHVSHVDHVNYMHFLVTHPVVPIQPPQAPTAQPPIASSTSPVHNTSVPTGDYSCSSLESLWTSVGGNPADAFIAAEIATAESGGNSNAISPTNDYGLWQINGSWGAMASLDPTINARSAVTISHDGTDWSPWTTFTSGAYIGRC